MTQSERQTRAMKDRSQKNDERVRAYKAILQNHIEKQPSGLRKKIANAIGTNRSFVSQITNSTYRVPIPANYVHTIIKVCHLPAVERADFLAAYMAAHPGQAALIDFHEAGRADAFTIDLSEVTDEELRAAIKSALKSMADAMIALAAKR